MNRLTLILLTIIFVTALSACGTLEVGIEKTSTPSVTGESDNRVTLAASDRIENTPTPSVTGEAPDTAWVEYTDPTYRVSLRYPAHWQPMEGQGYQTRWGGPDGFFQLSAMPGAGWTLDEACQAQACPKPCSVQPTVEKVQIQGLAACRIIPPVDIHHETSLVVPYPQPVRIGGEVYHFLILWTDLDHYQEIAETLRFIDLAPLPEPTTLFSDPVLGIAFDVPSDWQVESHPGAEARFTVPDKTGTARGVLTLSVLSEESTTLDLALDEVRRGAWGPFIRKTQTIILGEFRALRVEMTPEGDRPSVVWLVVTPSGRAVSFIPHGDPALIEATLVTLRVITP